jgi:hypothetical protein
MKLILLSALVQTAVLAEDTSESILVDKGGKHQTKYLRKLKKNLLVLLHGEIVNKNQTFAPTGEDSKNLNRGFYAVASKHSGTIKLPVPQDTQISHTLFLFLR